MKCILFTAALMAVVLRSNAQEGEKMQTATVVIDTAVSRFFIGRHIYANALEDSLSNAKGRELQQKAIIKKRESQIEDYKRDSVTTKEISLAVREKTKVSLDSCGVIIEHTKKQNVKLKVGLGASIVIAILAVISGG